MIADHRIRLTRPARSPQRSASDEGFQWMALIGGIGGRQLPAWVRWWVVDGWVVAVVAAGGAGPGPAAVGVGVDLPAAFVLEAVVVPTETPEVGRGGTSTGSERD